MWRLSESECVCLCARAHFFTFIKICLLIKTVVHFKYSDCREKFRRNWRRMGRKKASRHTTAHTNQSGETRQQLFSCCNLHKYAERVNLDLIDALVFIFPRTKCVPGNALFFFLSFCVWQRFAWQHIDATT